MRYNGGSIAFNAGGAETGFLGETDIYFYIMSSVDEHHDTPIKRQKINAFNIFILIFVGLGSMSYGYTASVIGQTLVNSNTLAITLFL